MWSPKKAAAKAAATNSGNAKRLSTKSEERQDSDDNHDMSNDVNSAVHDGFFLLNVAKRTARSLVPWGCLGWAAAVSVHGLRT